MLESLFLLNCIFIKLQAALSQQTPAQVLSCEYNEIFKNTFFYRKASLLLHIYIDCFQQIFLLAQRNAFSFAQKQPAEVFSEKRCLRKFRDIHRKIPVLQSLFSKVADFQTYNFNKKRLQHRYIPVGIAKFLWIFQKYPF